MTPSTRWPTAKTTCASASNPARFFSAEYDNRAVALLHLLCLALLAAIGARRGLDAPFYAALIFALGCAIYQQFLCRNRDREKCLRAFLNNNWFGAAVFCGLALALW